MKITIRKATIQDCNTIYEIHVSSIRELGKSHYREDQVASWSGGRTPERYNKFIKNKHVVIAEYHSIPVGFGTFDVTTGELIQLYVKPEYTRKGVGIRILNELLDLAKEKGLAEAYCDVSLNAERFYVNSGFTPGSKTTHRFNDGNEMDCIPMRKILS